MAYTRFRRDLPPPDFVLMTRDDLENYAADVDGRLRETLGEVAQFHDRFLVWAKAVVLANPGQFRVPTATTARLIAALKSINQSKDALMGAMYRGEIDFPESKMIDVSVCKARKFLRPLGYDVQTNWGIGYSLPKKTGLEQAIADYEADPTCVPRVGDVPPAVPRVPGPRRAYAPQLTDAQRYAVADFRQAGARPRAVARQLGCTEVQVRAEFARLSKRDRDDARARSNG